jgi:hypothetical protein
MSMFPYIMIFIIIIQTKCTIDLLPIELLKFIKFSYVNFLRTLGWRSTKYKFDLQQ